MGAQNLQESVVEDVLFYEIEDLIRITGFKEDTLKKYFLHDPRVLRWQRRGISRGKRIWLAKETRETIKEIVLNEWEI